MTIDLKSISLLDFVKAIGVKEPEPWQKRMLQRFEQTDPPERIIITIDLSEGRDYTVRRLAKFDRRLLVWSES